MATEQHHQPQKRVLKQDGYLELPGAPCKMRNVLYHPQLNVLLLFECGNLVKVLDANSGVILQTYVLGTNEKCFSTDLPNLLDIPRVKIPEGQSRYLLLLAHSHGYSGLGKTIVRGADVKNHLEIFDQALEEMEAQGVCAKCLGGGMIDNDVSGKKIKIYGFSSTFGNADHFRTKNILQSLSKFKDFQIVIKE